MSVATSGVIAAGGGIAELVILSLSGFILFRRCGNTVAESCAYGLIATLMGLSLVFQSAFLFHLPAASLVIEAIVMTLGAALAGIAAGAVMGYVTYYSERILAQEHVNFAVDTTVIPFIVIMVVLASILGAAFSARRIVKKKAVEILRM